MAHINSIFEDPSARRQVRTELNQFEEILRRELRPAQTAIEIPDSWALLEDNYNPENEDPHVVFTDVKGNYHKLALDEDVGDLRELICDKQDKLTAGDNITILNNVISSAMYDDTSIIGTLAEHQQRIDALQGALIYIGNINLPNNQVTQTALNERAQELNRYPLQHGFVLVDADAHDWWYDDDSGEWADIGGSVVAIATNTTLGIVKGSTEPLMGYVTLEGEFGINGLEDMFVQKAGDTMTGNLVVASEGGYNHGIDFSGVGLDVGKYEHEQYETLPDRGASMVYYDNSLYPVLNIKAWGNSPSIRLESEKVWADGNLLASGDLSVEGESSLGNIHYRGDVTYLDQFLGIQQIKVLEGPKFVGQLANSGTAGYVRVDTNGKVSGVDAPENMPPILKMMMLNQGSSNLMWSGNWTFNDSGVLSQLRSNDSANEIVSIPVLGGPVGSINWLPYNTDWPNIQGLGNTPSIAGGQNITIPIWTAIIGRFNGGNSNNVTLYAVHYQSLNVQPLPGDVLICVRHQHYPVSRLMLGNGQVIGGDVQLKDGALLDTGRAAASHNHSMGNITTGNLAWNRVSDTPLELNNRIIVTAGPEANKPSGWYKILRFKPMGANISFIIRRLNHGSGIQDSAMIDNYVRVDTRAPSNQYPQVSGTRNDSQFRWSLDGETPGGSGYNDNWQGAMCLWTYKPNNNGHTQYFVVESNMTNFNFVEIAYKSTDSPQISPPSMANINFVDSQTDKIGLVNGGLVGPLKILPDPAISTAGESLQLIGAYPTETADNSQIILASGTNAYIKRIVFCSSPTIGRGRVHVQVYNNGWLDMGIAGQSTAYFS